jgi:Transposase IS116/IS110/IS902 family
MKTALADLHRALLRLIENDELCRRFMTIPGIGPVTALAFKATIDDQAWFRTMNDVGAHLGLASERRVIGGDSTWRPGVLPEPRRRSPLTFGPGKPSAVKSELTLLAREPPKCGGFLPRSWTL